MAGAKEVLVKRPWSSLIEGLLGTLIALIVLFGCAGKGEVKKLDILPKFPAAQSAEPESAKIVIEPFEDMRREKNRLGLRTHLGGGATYFDVAGGQLGETLAEGVADSLRQRAWNDRSWDARVIPSGVAVTGADIAITGQITEFSANAKSRFFSTKIWTELRLTLRAKNALDDSVTTRHVEGAQTQTVFWFETDDVKKLLSTMLKDAIDRFVADTKIVGKALKSIK